jgi:hypothetical protein
MILPNPKKEAQCNFSISQVKEAIKELPKHSSRIELMLAIDAMNMYQYKFSCLDKSIFNVGMYLNVALQEVATSHTLIQLECRKQIFAIDKGIEVHECTEFMIDTFSLLDKILAGVVKK